MDLRRQSGRLPLVTRAPPGGSPELTQRELARPTIRRKSAMPTGSSCNYQLATTKRSLTRQRKRPTVLAIDQ